MAKSPTAAGTIINTDSVTARGSIRGGSAQKASGSAATFEAAAIDLPDDFQVADERKYKDSKVCEQCKVSEFGMLTRKHHWYYSRDDEW
jgi:hypothetical protein